MGRVRVRVRARVRARVRVRARARARVRVHLAAKDVLALTPPGSWAKRANRASRVSLLSSEVEGQGLLGFGLGLGLGLGFDSIRRLVP